VQAASREAKGWPAERCRVRPNAVDCRRYAPATDRRAARAALGLPERVTVATFGRFVAQKRMGDVVEVARRIAASFPHAQFLIAGGGPEEPALRAAAAAAGLGDRLQLLGQRADTERILAASEIYLSASGGEVLSLAILEAMAAGCAVVATDAGGTREQVAEGISGSLAPVGAVARLAGAVELLLVQPELRAAFGRAGRRIALERFDVPAVAAAQAAIYDQLPVARPIAI
jgi:glycosyltransferase involved in cell wall biosynthesis